MANAGSEHTAANFSSKLLLPIPQSPRMANELVLPAANPCCKAYRNASMCCLRPTNSSGLAGKFGSGSTSDLRKVTEVKVVKLTFLIFVTLGGLHGGWREHTPPAVQKWKDLFGGPCCLW